MDHQVAQDATGTHLDWHRALIALRATIPPGTPVEVHFDEAAKWLTLRRGHLVAAFNFAPCAQTIPLPAGNWQPKLATSAGTTPFSAGSTTVLTSIVT